MTFLEKDLEDIIYETDNCDLQDCGLWIFGKKIRQLQIGNYGIADIVTVDRHSSEKTLVFEVYELKKDVLNTSSFLQCLRYAKGIDMWLKVNKSFDYKINITLIGRSIDTSDNIVYLTDFMPTFKIYTYDYGFNGIKFQERSGFYLKNQGF